MASGAQSIFTLIAVYFVVASAFRAPVFAVYDWSRNTTGAIPQRNEKQSKFQSRRLVSTSKAKRTVEHILKDCFHVTSEEGHYYYKATADDSTVCGVYIVAEPNQVIEVYFDYLDVPCSSKGLLAFVDGWELSGGYFPTLTDHKLSLEERISEFCGLTPPSKIFISSQNAALIQYRIPKRARGFSFRVKFVKNPTPCNVLVSDTLEGVFTLRNYGRSVNCSVTAIFPIHVSLLSLGIGVTLSGHNFKMETGTLSKCEESGWSDYLEFKGGIDLKTPVLVSSDTLCGFDSYPGPVSQNLLCGVSSVRLVSSGLFDNSATVAIRQVNDEDMLAPDAIACL